MGHNDEFALANSNDESRMTKEIRTPKSENTTISFVIQPFGILSSLGVSTFVIPDQSIHTPKGASGYSPSFLPQLYFFWNFSTRPAVSTYFILPV